MSHMSYTSLMANENARLPVKFSHATTISFRPGSDLRDELERLALEIAPAGTDPNISEIVRAGLTNFWPQIRAWHKARHADSGLTSSEIDRSVAAITKAHELGLSVSEIEQAIADALTEKAAVAV